MVQLDFQAREITVKLVYYGPAMSGKTTNLQQVHARVVPEARGRLTTLDTKNDRTLFFDLLPIHFTVDGTYQLRIKLFTVPGQVMHDATRRLVLKGADGVAFVADSQREEHRANRESFASLRANLRAHGLEDVPVVIQFNKRDLPGAVSESDIDQVARRSREPVFRAVALRGEGVIETLLGLAGLTWEAVERKHAVQSKLGLSKDAFLAALRQRLRTEPEIANGTDPGSGPNGDPGREGSR